MFGKKKTVSFSNATTLIAFGTTITGDIQFNGTLEIEGIVVGNIVAEEASNATVRVLERGQVKGEIKVASAIINGKVDGNVHSSGYLELASQALIEGNVDYNVIEMAKGAQVNGNLLYTPQQAEVKAIEHLGKQES